MKSILIIDNYDSFTFNLRHTFVELGFQVDVLQNDCSIEIVKQQLDSYDNPIVVISPGPGHPDDAGISADVIHHCDGRYPVLGICLGHQVMANVFAGDIQTAERIVHGKQSLIECESDHPIFKQLPKQIAIGRYHSLRVNKLPDQFKLLAKSQDDQSTMMMLKNDGLMLGIQFHPESILSIEGHRILENSLNYLSSQFKQRKAS